VGLIKKRWLFDLKIYDHLNCLYSKSCSTFHYSTKQLIRCPVATSISNQQIVSTSYKSYYHAQRDELINMHRTPQHVRTNNSECTSFTHEQSDGMQCANMLSERARINKARVRALGRAWSSM
jgi:hypothetical protein